jgi:hypothetical protein
VHKKNKADNQKVNSLELKNNTNRVTSLVQEGVTLLLLTASLSIRFLFNTQRPQLFRENLTEWVRLWLRQAKPTSAMLFIINMTSRWHCINTHGHAHTHTHLFSLDRQPVWFTVSFWVLPHTCCFRNALRTGFPTLAGNLIIIIAVTNKRAANSRGFFSLWTICKCSW